MKSTDNKVFTLALVLFLSFSVSSLQAASGEGVVVNSASSSILSGWSSDGTNPFAADDFNDLDDFDVSEIEDEINNDLTNEGTNGGTNTNFGGELRVELVRGGDGRENHEQIMLGELIVDILPPRTLCPTHKPNFVEKLVVLYGDQQCRRWRANGYGTDIPFSGHIEKVEKGEGQKANIIWRKENGNRYILEVVTINERGSEFPEYDEKPLESKLIEGNAADNGTEYTTYGGSDENPFSEKFDEAQTETGHNNEVATIQLPGNSYGVDAVLSDVEIEMVAQEEINKIRQAFQGPAGTSLNEWGVQVGNGITQSGGVDGYCSPIHFWVATNATVRSAVEEAARNVRRQLSAQ